jgi:hypothetical protein
MKFLPSVMRLQFSGRWEEDWRRRVPTIGRKFRSLVAAIANSILQGNLLIDEAEFVKRFPARLQMFSSCAVEQRGDRFGNVDALQDVGPR